MHQGNAEAGNKVYQELHRRYWSKHVCGRERQLPLRWRQLYASIKQMSLFKFALFVRTQGDTATQHTEVVLEKDSLRRHYMYANVKKCGKNVVSIILFFRVRGRNF